MEPVGSLEILFDTVGRSDIRLSAWRYISMHSPLITDLAETYLATLRRMSFQSLYNFLILLSCAPALLQ